jgi:hypothetical protein
MRQQLTGWWHEHSPGLADMPKRRDLNRVRAEFLDTFVSALLPLNTIEPLQACGRHRHLVD